MKKVNNKDAIRIQIRLLKISGIWPSTSSTLVANLWCAWNFLLAYLNIIFMFHGLLVANNFFQLMQNLNFFVPVLTYYLKVTTFYFKRPKLLQLLDFLQKPIFFFYPDNLEKHLERSVKTSTFLMKLFQVIMYPTASLVCFIPFFKTKHERLLPFDYGMTDLLENSKFYYILLYLLQGCSLFLVTCNCIGCDGIATSLMGLAAAYFKILQETIKTSTKSVGVNKDKPAWLDNYSKFDKQVNRRLKQCIDFHLAIIAFVKNTEEIFTYIFLLQFLVSGVTICLAGFMIVMASPGSYESLIALGCLGTFMFQIVLYCVYGDEITYQSLKVRDACYMTEWIYCGPKVRRTLFIIMEYSKRPAILTAGKFFHLSHASLVAILRSAYSYGAVLKQFYKK